MSDLSTDDALYDQGHRDGYRKGEMERVALATANSELRSQVRELQALLDLGPVHK